MAPKLQNLINGQWVDPTGGGDKPLLNPADGTTVLAQFIESSPADVDRAVAAAVAAFPAWRDMPVIRRCRILFHCKQLLEQRSGQIAECMVRENGKTLAEAEGEVRRGIEVVEFAAGMPSMAKGDFIENIATRVDGYIYREPLGVVAGACPFNFPAMIPMWMFPVAIACGNTFILKPSDKCPMTGALVAGIMHEGGVPDGVLSVVHGGGDVVQQLITHPQVEAISFVGSTPVAEIVWRSAAAAGKRVQALGGAKNYIVVMPDADIEETAAAVIGSTYGCAGERCMASSVLVPVAGGDEIVDRVIALAKSLQLGDGLVGDTGMGPVITAEHKRRVESYIQIGVDEGATLRLDGRRAQVEGLPHGFFVGPTVFDHVTPSMRIAQEEIFGPVLSVMRAASLDEAITFANATPFGNGNSIFTASGGAARKFRNEIECGMIGINAGVPAPMAFFSFGGHKRSIFGDLRVHGPDGIEFYTRKKAVIERWPDTGPTGSVWGK
ncbi:MAG: CoA-acylating methylmalonate-semialdehyde dehydrogenase [bacterium]|nr:CoA-acylating methylmalonate-semialdehyde dehydrogenase [bacterium]